MRSDFDMVWCGLIRPNEVSRVQHCVCGVWCTFHMCVGGGGTSVQPHLEVHS